jgi:hypothetical protein
VVGGGGGGGVGGDSKKIAKTANYMGPVRPETSSQMKEL